MEWVKCSYDEACEALAANKKVQYYLPASEDWNDVDFVLADWPDTWGREKFRYEKTKNDFKSRPDLFPPRALQLAGEVLAFGETKYPDEKWKRMSAEEHIGASMRHLLEHLSGNLNDTESTKLHLTHSFVRLGMALEQYITQR